MSRTLSTDGGMMLIAFYLLACLVSYWVLYLNAVDLNFRIDHSKIDDGSFWRSLKSQNRETWKLLCLDFFKIHCPWSKKISIRYRIEEAHRLLQYCEHEKGWKAEDCHNMANHKQIARDCFCYRTTFWLKGLVHFLISPAVFVLQIVIVLIGTVVLSFVELYQFVFSR